jgi:hypothetical protein
MGIIWLECEIKDSSIAELLINKFKETGTSKLKVEDEGSTNGFIELDIVDLNLKDDENNKLSIAVECAPPEQISTFPKWIRSYIRESWQSWVEHPCIIWRVAEEETDPMQLDQRKKEIMDWLFRRN